MSPDALIEKVISGQAELNFDFHASDALLDYARDIYERFDTPCLSVDIGSRDGDFYLFEYQALHFGINVIIKGNGFYRHSSQGWEFIDDKTFFEHALADALIYHLETRKLV
jgi:hypothetical protein